MIRLLIALALAAPVLAQTPTDAPMADRPSRLGKGPLAGVSAEGRALIAQALRPGDPRELEALKAARDEVGRLMAAEPLDVAALRRAMAHERRLVAAMHERRQEALLAVLPRLSVADRRAFAQAARRGRDRLEARAEAWRRWHEESRRNRPPPGG
ncbi:MAG: hypothetical protein NZM40_02530 [Sphingomonadaceae bacterium]|uniref:hypothetical protein n=1 Tax=Thermaurantiacus sp. TaxID=2820283 RepID=UPI00298F2B32|nr:hypothetical protein [Thermaurantiacus sp.]MCS6986301.1 hypothetical protein [Sphingomonadaceae bacterium]MDW8415750.1 hypothetical protein [Thermaurantiacus sp.]